MHRILERQLHHLSLDPIEEYGELFEMISKTYADFDAERKMMEHSLDVSSEELAQVITILRSTIDSVDEGIIVFDKKGMIVNHNKRFIEIWEIPDSVMTQDTEQKLLAMSAMVIDESAFKEMFFGAGFVQLKKFVSKIIKLKNGKILDTYSNPQIVKGEKHGKVCIFRDITRHFQAELDLKQKVDAMERLNKSMVDREIKMIELKKRIKEFETHQAPKDSSHIDS